MKSNSQSLKYFVLYVVFQSCFYVFFHFQDFHFFINHFYVNLFYLKITK